MKEILNIIKPKTGNIADSLTTPFMQTLYPKSTLQIKYMIDQKIMIRPSPHKVEEALKEKSLIKSFVNPSLITIDKNEYAKIDINNIVMLHNIGNHT
ncbi:hypothetical protein [uncultured Muribaculum sp.]|uniref:hypothetical protein n=1 Tax=uncultured Muribaculum sp. TaxID=1918613 RepID=UPI0027307CBF|nr:hypothetical protein [uncultured Muribaculum sp.]